MSYPIGTRVKLNTDYHPAGTGTIKKGTKGTVTKTIDALGNDHVDFDDGNNNIVVPESDLDKILSLS